jgi:hypothetical protein
VLSCHERCGLACQAAGVAAVNAAFAAGFLTRKYDQHLQMLPEPSVIQMPAGLFWINDAERVEDFSNIRDRIGYPVHWAVIERGIKGKTKLPTDLLNLREVTADVLRNQLLDVVTVPESALVEWVPEKVIDEKYPAFEYLISPMTFICWCKRTRGLK